jgi:hypothetical protein
VKRVSLSVCLSLLAVLIVTSQMACGDGPSGPSPGAVRAEIVGPSSIAPGQTASYSVIEHSADGTSLALSSATWTAADASLIQIAASGLATAQPRTGETVISVKTGRASATKEVLVLPSGTFRLAGAVIDSEAGGVPIPDARVEVVDGPAVTTTANGTYRLYGVPGEADIRVTRPGYGTVVQSVRLTGNGTQNFTLSVDASVRNISGNYTLSIEVNGACAGFGARAIPPNLRRRAYDAVVTQSGSRLAVVLTESRFQVDQFGRGNGFQGQLTPAGATFTLLPADYYDPIQQSDLMERIDDGTLLSIYGTGTTISSPSGFTGTLNGWFSQYSTGGGSFFLADCQAGRLTLSPR